MNATALVEALRNQRETLAARWRAQFLANRAAIGRFSIDLSVDLAGSLLDEVVVLLASTEPTNFPRRHHARAFARVAKFPENIAVCIDVFQAGSQVVGAFVVENAGPTASWSISSRNRFLGEIDAVFHVLVHREIEALCEVRLDVSDLASTPGTGAFKALEFALHEIPDDALLRN